MENQTGLLQVVLPQPSMRNHTVMGTLMQAPTTVPLPYPQR